MTADTTPDRARAWDILERNAPAAPNDKNVAELEWLLLQPYQYFRIEAAGHLGLARSVSSMALLGAALNDRSDHVAEAAADALAALATAAALELLRVAFEDDQLDRPNHLASAIATFGPVGFDILARCVRSSSPTIRFHAARGLGSTGLPAAEPILQALLLSDLAVTRSGATVATAAKAALKTLDRLRRHRPGD